MFKSPNCAGNDHMEFNVHMEGKLTHTADFYECLKNVIISFFIPAITDRQTERQKTPNSFPNFKLVFLEFSLHVCT
jgi:hypothetical protein